MIQRIQTENCMLNVYRIGDKFQIELCVVDDFGGNQYAKLHNVTKEKLEELIMMLQRVF